MIEEFDLFSYVKPKFKIDKPIRLIETFAGIGSQAKALKNLGANFEHWKVIEFEQHAIDSYNAIHNTNFATQDITQTHATDLEIVERESYCYVLTYSFPCQDLSNAGLKKGFEKGSGTRSGLLWEIERILDECNGNLPQVLLLENVPQLHSEGENMKNFQLWLRKLESLGYTNYWKDLNAKNYGIPQNRKRCFCVSILGDYYYYFPKPKKLELRLKDLLEKDVDEKYYLSENMINYVLNRTPLGNKPAFANNIIGNDAKRNAGTLTTSSTVKGSDNFLIDNMSQEEIDREIYLKGLPINNNTKQGYLIAQDGDGIDISTRMQHHRGTVQKGICQTLKTQQDVGVCVVGNYMPSGHEAGRVISPNGIAPTIKENHGTVNAVEVGDGLTLFESEKFGGVSVQKEKSPTIRSNKVCVGTMTRDLRIRKLTSRECYRLMGFTDEDYDAAKKVNSETQLYKQAGNSIVVQVLMAIFGEML